MAGVLHLGPVKPWVKTAAEDVRDEFGITNIGGWRAKGSVPNSDHPKGRALDVMIKSTAQGNQVASWAIQNQRQLGATYVIWNRRIWMPDGGWKAYRGPVPHTDHVHISFGASPPAKSAGRVAPLKSGTGLGAALAGAVNSNKPAGGGDGGVVDNFLRGLKEVFGGPIDAAGDLLSAPAALAKLALPTTQLRIWSGVFGGIFVIIGLLVLARVAVKSGDDT